MFLGLHLMHVLSRQSRQEIKRPQVVIDRAAHAQPGKHLKRNSAVGIKSIDRLEQTDHTVAFQIFALDRGRDSTGHLPGLCPDQGEVSDGQTLADGSGALLLVTFPQRGHRSGGIGHGTSLMRYRPWPQPRAAATRSEKSAVQYP